MIEDLLDSIALAKRIDEHVLKTGRKPLVLGVSEQTWVRIKRRDLKNVKFQGIELAPMAHHG